MLIYTLKSYLVLIMHKHYAQRHGGNQPVTLLKYWAVRVALVVTFKFSGLGQASWMASQAQ